ncbi:MAG: hypothetical protein ACM33T_01955 [Solirubrobacterales bacterium]
MLDRCPYCHNPLPAHGQCCRVPVDLDRFERVYHLLDSDHHNEFLQHNLARHLKAFGRWINEPGY